MRAKPNTYWYSGDGLIGYGLVSTGEVFMFDAEDYSRIKGTTWYRCNRCGNGIHYIGDRFGVCIHRHILDVPKGFEVDHINLDPLDNRKSNLRICTHQQNQCNQPPQKNNTSGVSGVSFYPARNKYRARIKYFQQELHLGYFGSFIEAVQARNEAMRFLFGEYGFYNDVPEAPPRIKEIVKEKCSRFLDEAAVFV